MYKIDVKNFKNFLIKATLNNSINNVEVIFNDGKVSSKMTTPITDVITILNKENEIIDSDESMEFYFSEPAQNLFPFLNLIDEDEAELNVRNNMIVIKNGNQRSNVKFCESRVITRYNRESVNTVDPMHTIDVDDAYIESYKKIKKIGSRFNKVYFTVIDGKLFIESTDKTEPHSNGLDVYLSLIESSDLTMGFKYSNFVNLMSVIDQDFKLNFYYNNDREMGMVSAISNDGSENYYLMSSSD